MDLPDDGEELETEELDELDEVDETEEQLEEEAPDEGETVEEEPPARRPSRAQARIEALDREAKSALERAEAAERRLQELQSGRSRSEAQDQERQERERLERMLPEERAEYIARQTQTRLTGELNSLRGQIAESSDRAEFATACASNPTLAKVKDKVETELAKLRAGGTNVPRATLAAYLIGQQVLEKAPKARERAAKKAAVNLDRERARPAGGSSDAPRGRDNDDRAARDKRLENFTF